MQGKESRTHTCGAATETCCGWACAYLCCACAHVAPYHHHPSHLTHNGGLVVVLSIHHDAAGSP